MAVKQLGAAMDVVVGLLLCHKSQWPGVMIIAGGRGDC